MSFVNALAANNLETQVRYYADSVDYYEFGQVAKEVIRKDLQHDITTWPKRLYTVPEPPKFSPDGNGFIAEFPMRYSLTNPKGTIGGILQMTVRFELQGGVWQVVGIQRKVIQAARGVTSDGIEVRKAVPAH